MGKFSIEPVRKREAAILLVGAAAFLVGLQSPEPLRILPGDANAQVARAWV